MLSKTRPLSTLNSLVAAISTVLLTNRTASQPSELSRMVVGSEASVEAEGRQFSGSRLAGENQTTATTAPDSMASSGAGQEARPQANDQNMDKKSIRSLQTPLSIIKVSPLNTFFNNKVGSASFQSQSIGVASGSPGGANAQSFLNGLATVADNLLLPVRLRKVRDSGSLLFMLAYLGFLAYIIWDGLVVKETDVNLIVHGHDSYGNICGRNNRPIQFVDKSGRNYTDRPYTKYTLINSQFERYTLDSNRLKKGELIYVKESGQQLGEGRQIYDFRPHKSQEQSLVVVGGRRDSFSAAGGVALRKLSSSRRNGTIILVTGPRRKRAAPLLQEADPELAVENRSLLNVLKSSLMYQYPTMYGYTPTGAKPAGGSDRPAASSLATINIESLGAPQQRSVQLVEGSLTSSSPLPSPGYDLSAPRQPAAATATSIVIERPLASRTTLRTFTALDLDNGSALGANDSDSYDHMLVTPTSTNIAHASAGANGGGGGGGGGGGAIGRTPLGIPAPSQAEVSSQLLYLTECVPGCPADHMELIFFRCMPSNWRFSLFPTAINVTRTFVDDILTDVSHCYRELIYTFSLALVLSLGLLILLRFLASLIIWSCILLLVSLFLAMASYSWLTYYYQILDLNQLMPHDSIYAERLSSSDKWLIGSIFLTFLSFATIGTVLFMRRRILMVTMLFRESGKAIADMPLLLLQPLLTFAALLGITIVWSVGLICLQAMKVPAIDLQTGFVVFKAETLYKIMKWYHIFAFLWVSHFAIACQHYVIGSAVSKWYFSTNRYQLGSPIGSSISELILYYLGSVALGSFLVAIFKVFRIITRQIHHLVQRNCIASHSPAGSSGGSQSRHNPLLASGMPSSSSSSCCGSFSYIWRLFIWFFDNIVMIINRDAYVEIAIHGHSFLAGARRALTVLASNPLRLLAIKSVSNILLMVAKICVVFGTVSVAIILLEEKNQKLNYSWSPIVISAIYAYIVAHWFLSVYEMVIDALFICYCEDYELSKTRELSAQLTGSNFMAQVLNNGQIYGQNLAN